MDEINRDPDKNDQPDPDEHKDDPNQPVEGGMSIDQPKADPDPIPSPPAPPPAQKAGIGNRISQMWNAGTSSKIVMVGFVVLVLFCCCITLPLASRGNAPAAPTVDIDAISTNAMATAQAPLTQTALAIPTNTNTPENTATPQNTATPENTSTSAAIVDAYMIEMGVRFINYNDAFQSFLLKQNEVSEDITLLLDDEWKTEMGLILGMLDLRATDLEAIPNLSPKYQQIDEYLKQIASETHLLVNNFATGVDNLDSAAIERSTVNLQNLTAIANFASQEIDRLNALP